jgi:ABC-type lipoprotein release transport system permease subunit
MIRISILAFLSIWRRPVSSFIAIAAIGISIGMGALLLTLHQSLSESIDRRDKAVDVIIGPKSSSLQILMDGLHLTGKNPDIFSYDIIRIIKGRVKPLHIIPIAQFAEYGSLPVIGTDYSFVNRPKQLYSPQCRTGRWFKNEKEAVMGCRAAAKSGLGIGDSLRASSRLMNDNGELLWQESFKITGILQPMDHAYDNAVYVDIRQAWSMHRLGLAAGKLRRVEGQRGVSQFLLSYDPRNPNQRTLLRESIQERGTAVVVDVKEEIYYLRTLLGYGQSAAAAIAGLIILLSISIASLLLNERFETMKTELGVLWALGYDRSTVGCVIALEGAGLATAGVLLGILIERLAVLAVYLLWTPPWLVASHWPGRWLVILWSGALLVSLLATIPPLLRLYRWNPHDVLKGM